VKAAELVEIRETVNERPWRDPARYPECVQIALEALGVIALLCDCGEPECPSYLAEQALRAMARRAHFGGPLDEPTGEIL